MLNIVSFSLWGDALKYTEGAKINTALAHDIYPGWTVRIHCGPDIPPELIEELRNLGADCRLMDDIAGPFHGLFWRFLPASDPQVDIMLCRDLDSRLNWRERAAVDEWLESGEPFHVMRDHPAHHNLIMGCSWGVRGGFLQNMSALIEDWNLFDQYGRDEQFLAETVWPLIKHHHMAHDGFFELSGDRTWSFPSHRPITPLNYVGERVFWSPLPNPTLA